MQAYIQGRDGFGAVLLISLEIAMLSLQQIGIDSRVRSCNSNVRVELCSLSVCDLLKLIDKFLFLCVNLVFL